jgi:hypothetical protein
MEAADQTAQGLGSLRTVISLITTAVLCIGCLAVGMYLLVAGRGGTVRATVMGQRDTPVATKQLGTWLVVGGAVLAVVWLIIFSLRRNRWFLRLQGASAIR